MFEDNDYRQFKYLSYYYIAIRKFPLTKWEYIKSHQDEYFKMIMPYEVNKHSTVIKITHDKKYKGYIAILK